MHKFESIFPKFSRGMLPDSTSMTRGLQTKVFSFYDKNGSKMHNFEAILQSFPGGHAPRATLYDSGFTNTNFKFTMQIMALKRTIFCRFFQNFLGGMPPNLPSMTRGLQSNVASHTSLSEF